MTTCTGARCSARRATAVRRAVSIGEDLAQARRRAGLTVTQVSQRTGIRKKITAPLSVRLQRVRWRLLRPGAHRVIARVAGADPGPLIAGYDAAHRAPQPITAADLLRPAGQDPRAALGGLAAVLGLALVGRPWPGGLPRDSGLAARTGPAGVRRLDSGGPPSWVTGERRPSRRARAGLRRPGGRQVCAGGRARYAGPARQSPARRRCRARPSGCP